MRVAPRLSLSRVPSTSAPDCRTEKIQIRNQLLHLLYLTIFLKLTTDLTQIDFFIDFWYFDRIA